MTLVVVVTQERFLELSRIRSNVCLGCPDPNSINYYENLTEENYDLCVYSHDYVHGLWNEVDDGLIQYNESVESLSSLQQALDAWNTKIDLEDGWNMFGYGCPESINLIDGVSNYSESIMIVKDDWGLAYLPEYGFNGIGDLTLVLDIK